MTASRQIKALLDLTEKKQLDLAREFGLSTPQAMNNKLRRDHWSLEEIAKIADTCGAKLAFVLPDGSHIVLTPDKTE